MAGEDEAAREGRLSFARIAELKLDPVRGNFDLAHLREVHRRIFQDLPRHDPGGFRPDAPGHVKTRALETTRMRYDIAYALRPEVDRRLGGVLDELRGGAALADLAPTAFVARMTRLYGELDHLHPFREGNSRTLRSFTEQLARRAGYALDWGTTNANAVTRDNLYMARDFAVIQRSFPGLAAKDPADIADRGEYAAYLALGELQKSDRLGEVIRQSVDRGLPSPGVGAPLPLAEVRETLSQLLPAARHQARWDEERARIGALRKPDLAPLHAEAVKRLGWIDGAGDADRMMARGVSAGIETLVFAAQPGERAIERVIGIGKALAAAERERHRGGPGQATMPGPRQGPDRNR